jgi:hypothetical protein
LSYVQGPNAEDTACLCVLGTIPTQLPARFTAQRSKRTRGSRVQECPVLATGERPSLLETHFSSNVWFPFSFLFPECTAQGLRRGCEAQILPRGDIGKHGVTGKHKVQDPTSSECLWLGTTGPAHRRDPDWVQLCHVELTVRDRCCPS